METKTLTIAIDGPASSGKSTVAKRIASDLNLIYVDTGAMYRTLTFEALKNNVNIKDQKALVNLLEKTDITFEPNEKGQTVYSNGVDVTYEIRENNVTNTVSVVAAHPKVRKLMVKRQQAMASDNGVVMDGRDIGTVVLPGADLKIFLVASVKERAERRHKENEEKGIFSDLDQLIKDIAERDYKDTTRESSPLKQAEDGIRIDTTNMSIEEVVNHIKALIKKL